MRAAFIVRAFAFTLVVAGTSILAAPAQTTLQPGQMTQARVWIENKSRAEAVPVVLRDVNMDSTLKVQIINGEQQYGSANPVQVRQVRIVWDYETLIVRPNDDVTAKLNGRGAAGWETTGIWSMDADGNTRMLLKRQR